jgi:hypothetical protein
MSDWMTITIQTSGLNQRVRKSSIIAYGMNGGVTYVLRGGHSISVTQSEAELRAELEHQKGEDE